MLNAAHMVDTATATTGLDDFGGTDWREGLDRLVDGLNQEADLTEIGTHILGSRLDMLLANRLRVVATVAEHREITDQEVEGPLFIIGLPRTGTTALSNLLAADPRIRSVRLWESSDPVPPPEADHQDDDPRIEAASQGLELMYETFPRMRSLHFQSATGPTECQDLLGMEFRTEHFDGMARVPSYVEWVLDCDMAGTYAFHRQVLQLLQWHCPPRLWHLKTPVHMLALDALAAAYPSAKFLWTHRDPAPVLGSVCSLIAYTRSWASDRYDPEELGRDQLALWAEAIRRALDFRDRTGEGSFADVSFADLQSDPVGALAAAYEQVGLDLEAGRGPVEAWARDHPPGAHGVHEFALANFGLDAAGVRERFDSYLARFPAV
jgi:sulfotransferase family protein